MYPRQLLRDERGIALVVVLMVTLAVAVLSAGAALVGMNATIINRYSERHGMLVAAADAGLEEARSLVNGDETLYPDSLYSTLEGGSPVYDASGTMIPNIRRSIYVGPTGQTSGQYGVFGSVVVAVEDNFRSRVVRRSEIVQESFAKYAYFTDVEPSNISFGGGDQIQGPVHTNDHLKIYSSGATFLGPVITAKTVMGGQYGTFAQGYTENGPRIEMPQTADLNRLRVQGMAGGTAFTGNSGGGSGQATTRIEFLALDLNADGQVNGANEGFIRVYQSTNAGYVVADVPTDYSPRGLRNSENCGHYHGGTFVVADDHPTNGPDSWVASVSSSTRRCYLGGSDALWGGFQATDLFGRWLQWTGPVDPLVAGRPDAQYLIPINREMNPSFKGVIFVDGKVAVSGVVRGQVTLAATDDIIIADDLVYATNPGAGTCNDMLGVFSGDDILLADNTINAPVRPATGQNVENYAGGATKAEPCETRLWGRGCLYLTGGIIQQTRGAVGTIRSPGGTGYLKRYSYDQCAMSATPPYFPTTGHFMRGRYYEVDPVGFDVASYWKLLTPY
jgi:hypothetical protein